MKKPASYPSSVPVWDDSEAILLEQVRDLARRTGWKTYHTLRSTGSEPGFPDLILLRDAECLVVELKSAQGKLTREQADWLYAFALVPGIEIVLWYPKDWTTIVKRLTRAPITMLPGKGGPPYAPQPA